MIETCCIEEISDLVQLAKNIYDGSTEQELYQEFLECLKDSKSELLLFKENRIMIGFAQFQIRTDYVEGTSSSPCGYLEGVFVLEGHRRQGIAKKLVEAGEQWCKEQGCVEIGSDCHIDNLESFKFHQQIGFREVSRNIHFVK